jgi:VanZ family protein
VLAYITAILPQDLVPSIPELSDKGHHVFAFVVLGILLRLAYKINYWYGLLILVVFGMFIEVSQYFTTTRVAEEKDVLADLIGAFIGLKLYKYLRKVI